MEGRLHGYLAVYHVIYQYDLDLPTDLKYATHKCFGISSLNHPGICVAPHHFYTPLCMIPKS